LGPKSLKPEEKVNATIQMTDAVVKICADGIRDQNPNMTEEQLQEELRKRINRQKRGHHEV
jgi:hypothetical protein